MSVFYVWSDGIWIWNNFSLIKFHQKEQLLKNQVKNLVVNLFSLILFTHENNEIKSKRKFMILQYIVYD